MLHRHGALSCWDYAAAGPVPADRHERGPGHRRTGRSRTRTRSSSRRTSSSAARARPACWWPSAGCCATASRRCPGGGTILFVSPDAGTPTTPTRRSARRAGRRRSSSRSAPASSFALKEAVGSEEIRRREHDFARRALRSWGANPHIEILGNPELERLAIVSLGLRHPGGHCCTRTSSSPCSATCSASRRAAAASAPGPYIHRMYPDRRRSGRSGWTPRSRKGHLGAKLAFTRLELQLLHQRGGLRLHRRRRPPGRRARAGSCCRSTASIPTAACGATATRCPTAGGRVRPDRCARRRPPPFATAPESVLAGQLEAARRDHRRRRGRAARGPPARSGAERGVRADPLVPAPGRGTRAAAGLAAYEPGAFASLSAPNLRLPPVGLSLRAPFPRQSACAEAPAREGRDVQFRILGPVEALGLDDRAVPVGGQPLRLLGLLLVRRGEPVAADSAIDALWGERLPANPANALQVVVSRLRTAVGAAAVAWHGGGYALQLDDPEAVDADRFTRLTAEGEAALARGDPARAAQRAARGDGAVARPGPPRRCATSPSPRAEVARLDELRLACLGARIDADLALGRARERPRRARRARRGAPVARIVQAPARPRAGARRPPGRGARRRPRRAARAGRRSRAGSLAGARSPCSTARKRSRRCRRGAKWSASRPTCASAAAASRWILRCSRT